jgi:hypothetical protein
MGRGIPTNTLTCIHCAEDTRPCQFYGDPLCSVCSGTPLPARKFLDEEVAIAIASITDNQLMSDALIEEKIYWLEHTSMMIHPIGCDDYLKAAEILSLKGKLLKTNHVIRLFETIESRLGTWHTNVAFQKAIVMSTCCPWLLPSNKFWVGLCYHGHFGDGPTKPIHVDNYIKTHGVPYDDVLNIYGTTVSRLDRVSIRGAASSICDASTTRGDI